MQVIDVAVHQNEPAKLSEIGDEVRKIALETSDDCLIGGIQQVLHGGDRIFVLDHAGPRIHVFDADGKFLRQVGNNGRGPGEYLYVSCITADTEYKHLYVASGSKIIRYDFEGNFIDEYTKTSYPEYISFANGSLFVFYSELGRPTGRNSFANITRMVTLERGWTTTGDTMMVKYVETPNVMASSSPEKHYISQSDNHLFVYYPVLNKEQIVRDTLYQLSNNVLEPYVKLNFSDGNGVRNKNVLNIFHAGHFIIAQYMPVSDNEKKYFCYDMKNGTAKNMSGGFEDDIYHTGLATIRPMNDGLFYFFTEWEEEVSSSTEPNPVLYTGRFK
jgi:hypothetical protein